MAFARAGAQVAVVDQDAARARETVAMLHEARGEALALVADVRDEAAVAGYVAATVAAWGRIDAFFNNAGVQGPSTPITDCALDFWQTVIETNLTGCFLGIKHVLPVMQGQGGGSIVNMASISGLIGYPGFAPYAASKHGILGLTRAVAVEVAQQGIRVNAVCPGPVESELMRAIKRRSDPADPDRVHAQIAGATPMQRYATPDEVAEVVCFLCSAAASYVNGAAWTIDGGITATQ